MSIFRTKISYIFTGTIDIEAIDEIDAEDQIGRLNVKLRINDALVQNSSLDNHIPTSERILVINKIKD
jgi:hypothetical protein